MRTVSRLFAILALLCLSMVATGQEEVDPPAAEIGVRAQVELTIPDDARAGPDFRADEATEAWLGTLSDADRARSDAYQEGGYWTMLWGFLYGIAVAALLLFTRLSAWIRDHTSWTRWTSLNAGFYGAAYVLVTSVLTLPWALYNGWYREHQYDLSNLALGEWFGEQAIGLLVGMVLAVLALSILYAVFRRTRAQWWVWGTGVSLVLMVGLMTLAPVFIQPLFNDYKPLPEGELRDEILSLARANDIPADDVYWFDASRQHSRISANVAGFGPTTRIALNDNLLENSSREGIEAVMAHEMGHYVLNHVSKAIWRYGVILFLGFAFVAWGYRRLMARYGPRWDIQGIDDPAGFPLLVALFSVYFFLLTPVTYNITRTAEMEADLYGLNAARQPDGFAETAMKLSTYRKIEPHWLEEALLYHHPSGRTRVETAMQWKAENLDAIEAETGSGD